jgi:hypothetical protein
MSKAPTIYEVLKVKLGREPTREELIADVKRIVREGAELAKNQPNNRKEKA